MFNIYEHFQNSVYIPLFLSSFLKNKTVLDPLGSEDKKLKELLKSLMNQLYNLPDKPTFRAICYHFNSGLCLNE